MTRLEIITKYAKECISGERIAGKKHVWACKRLIRDLERARADPEYPYYWDEKKAQNIVDWFELLYHSKGELAKTPIYLTEWQQFRLCQLFGWRRKADGFRRFKRSFTEVARKNAKSQEEAGIALYNLSVEAIETGEVHEIYTAGTKKDQSKIVFEEAKLMLRGSPLRMKFDVKRDRIAHIASGSFMKPLTREDGENGDGTNPALLVLDEYHQHATTDFYDLGMGSQTKDPLMMIITTAGKDLSYPCYTQEYQYCSKILDPDSDVENEEYLVDICELDPEDYKDLRKLDNEEMWLKANPIRATYQKGLEKIRGEYRKAMEIPEQMPSFLTKCMDVWMQAKDTGYMDMGKWKACEIQELPFDISEYSVYVGLDMSAKTDLTSVSFIIPFQTDEKDEFEKQIVKYILFSHSFIPNREKLMEHIAVDKVPYDAWEMMGLLTVTDTPIVDQSQVLRYIIEFCEQYKLKIEILCFDPANASKMMMDVSDMGYDAEEVFQSHKSLNESTSGFREQVYCKNIMYLPNPLLNYAMGNAVVRKNNGLIKIDKDATKNRVDPVDATLCAFKLALYHDFGESRIMENINRFLDEDW